MSDETTDPTELPLDVLDRIDRACDRFEATWDAGGRPQLEDYLDAVAAEHRAALLRDLLAAEIDVRRRHGERPEPGEYRDRLTGDAATIDAAFAACRDHPRVGRAETAPREPVARMAVGPDDAPDPSEHLGTPDAAGDPSDGLARGTRVRYFGDFELLRVLGRGGMGVVYKARQRSLNRTVAVKMIRAGLWAGDDEVRRFRNEAEAVANLDHPQIVTDPRGRSSTTAGSISACSSSTARAWPRRCPITPPIRQAAARLVAEVARAVHHAHQRGILHRDLKPSNIVLDAEGHPHVTDFGLAKRIEGHGDASVSGSILGTPSYMSPEQASGSGGARSQRRPTSTVSGRSCTPA